MKFNHKNFLHLVGLCTYCGMVHGAYNVVLETHLKLPSLQYFKYLGLMFLNDVIVYDRLFEAQSVSPLCCIKRTSVNNEALVFVIQTCKTH